MTPNLINALETWCVLLVSRDGEQILLREEKMRTGLSHGLRFPGRSASQQISTGSYCEISESP